MALHKNLIVGDIHIPYQWSYADQSAREGASGFDSSDIGKFARQLDDNSIWMLTATTPTWIQVGEGGTPGAHASTHENGGADEISVAGLSGTLADAQTPSSHASSHQDGGADEISVAGLSGELADNQPPKTHATSHEDGGSDELTVQNLGSGAAVSGKVLESDGTGGWNLINTPGAGVFGEDYQHEESTGRSSTTGTTFLNKVTLTTPALTGTYRLGWAAGIDGSGNEDLEVRLYNNTDAQVVGATRHYKLLNDEDVRSVSGIGVVTFTGAAKTFYLQYRSVVNAKEMGIQDAHVELWRVS